LSNESQGLLVVELKQKKRKEAAMMKQLDLAARACSSRELRLQKGHPDRDLSSAVVVDS
jgi:hypothetical protein